MDKKAFITGGTGFVGSHLAEALLERGYSEVRCLVRTKLKWLEGLDIVPVKGTLDDQQLIEDAVRDVDYVFHLGGVTRARSYEELYEGNVLATISLLDAITTTNPEIHKVLVTSTLATVGEAPDGRADETTPLRPISRYGRSKAQMEAELTDYQDQLPLVIVRPSSVYGPRDRDVYTLFKTVSQGLFPYLRGDPGLTLVHVLDLVRGMIAAAESDSTRGKTYFIGNDHDVSWKALKSATVNALGTRAISLPLPRSMVLPLAGASEGLSALLGKYPPFNREKGHELLRTAKLCSSARAAEDFAYQPKVSLAEGVHDAITWYHKEGWLRKKRSR